jgi:hypothetical protein
MRRTMVSVLLSLMSAVTLSGCDAIVDGSKARASVTERAFKDAASAWRDLFTYHPKEAPNSPQTRYCYQMMTDVVCYDSVQPGLTAKLLGYQDGNRISWVQPGGGSLGASGGTPVAMKAPTKLKYEHTIATNKPLEYTATEAASPNAGDIEIIAMPPAR